MPGMIDLSKTVKKTDAEYFPVLTPVEYPKYDNLDNLDISYKAAMNQSMTELGEAGAIFIGYNVVRGDAMGTLANVANDQKLETPVAENLMSGLAIGMSFEGFTPVLSLAKVNSLSSVSQMAKAKKPSNKAMQSTPFKLHNCSNTSVSVPDVVVKSNSDASSK